MATQTKAPCTKTPFQKQGNDRGETETDAQWYARNNGGHKDR